MEYVLENESESARLEFQAGLNNYQLSKEFIDLKIAPGSRVLDAGCGSGVVSRFLVDQFKGIAVNSCDFSPVRLDQAKTLAKNPPYDSIRFFTSTLENIQAEAAGFDWLVCRFVLEHLNDPWAVAREFFRVLRPGTGKICVVDLDGILFNLYSSHPQLSQLLGELQATWETDLFIGRKIPHILKKAGFKNISWKIQTMEFHGRDLRDEILLTQQRLEFIRPILEKFFKSQEKTNHFVRLYLEEMEKEETTLFYNKFIVFAERP